MIDVTVIVATYNRIASLRRILGDLATQTLAGSGFEVVVVDDGSLESAEPLHKEFSDRFENLTIHRQNNGGAAAARQKGATLAKGRLLVFLDDDMVSKPTFLAEHVAAHRKHDKQVVMGRLLPDQKLSDMPLFERFYARMLDRTAEGVAAGKTTLHGRDLYTGNLSIKRAFFFEVGGFDTSFGLIEDAELGVRLEAAGAVFELSESASTIHASDHTSKDRWFARSVKDGRFWMKLAKKHRGSPDANPWRYLGAVNPLSRPILALVALNPSFGGPLASAAFSAARGFDALGLDRLALAGTTLVYGIQYFRGVREETGSLADVVREYRDFRKALRHLKEPAMQATLMSAVRHDFEALQVSQGKYGASHTERGMATEAVNNIGFQLLILYRVMRALRAGGHLLGAKFCSRLMRHLYGSDIHWDAEFEPGVVVVHGFGMAINGEAYVSGGCILFQHVTLGRGLAHAPDAAGVKAAGAPKLERNVHVGVGCTIVGPVTIGARSKIMPGCTVTTDVPANSIVASPEPTLRARQ
jgi:serine acetyltransferase/GT2 family glycosyltransferase